METLDEICCNCGVEVLRTKGYYLANSFFCDKCYHTAVVECDNCGWEFWVKHVKHTTQGETLCCMCY